MWSHLDEPYVPSPLQLELNKANKRIQKLEGINLGLVLENRELIASLPEIKAQAIEEMVKKTVWRDNFGLGHIAEIDAFEYAYLLRETKLKQGEQNA